MRSGSPRRDRSRLFLERDASAVPETHEKVILPLSRHPPPISIPLNPCRTEDQFSAVPGGGIVPCANLNEAQVL